MGRKTQRETEKEDESLKECVDRQREGGRQFERMCGQTERRRTTV